MRLRHAGQRNSALDPKFFLEGITYENKVQKTVAMVSHFKGKYIKSNIFCSHTEITKYFDGQGQKKHITFLQLYAYMM